MYSCSSDRVVYDDPNDPEWQYPGEYADISGTDHTRDGQWLLWHDWYCQSDESKWTNWKCDRKIFVCKRKLWSLLWAEIPKRRTDKTWICEYKTPWHRLLWSERAKRIKNKPVKNEQIKYQTLIKQYEIQLKNLRNELCKKDEIINNNYLIRQINQLNEDKNNMIKQLEESSQKYLNEKNQNKNLEKQIKEIKKNIEENNKENLNEYRIAL